MKKLNVEIMILCKIDRGTYFFSINDFIFLLYRICNWKSIFS